MLIALKLLAVLLCLGIAKQDFESRAVTWVFFPLLGMVLGLLHYTQSQGMVFLYAIGINLLLVVMVITTLWAYSRIIMRRRFLNVSFGLGDLLLFLVFALGFPTLSFIVLLAGATLFSVCVHFVLWRKRKDTTVPLAGLMSLFLAAVLPAESLHPTLSLYML